MSFCAPWARNVHYLEGLISNSPLIIHSYTFLCKVRGEIDDKKKKNNIPKETRHMENSKHGHYLFPVAISKLIPDFQGVLSSYDMHRFAFASVTVCNRFYFHENIEGITCI